MPAREAMRNFLRKLLKDSDLQFRDFVEVTLYHPELGYYARSQSPIGRDGDYVTAPAISPVFGVSLAGLIREFLSRMGDGMSSIVDMGCGSGDLIHTLSVEAAPGAQFYGVDRFLERVGRFEGVSFEKDLSRLPSNDSQLVISNELFDAIPFARLVMRGEHLHELWVTERDGALDWTEHEADPAYDDYFAARGIELEDGQFADVSLEWERFYEDLCRFVTRGLIVTFDYGTTGPKLFRGRMHRFGTAAAYSQHRVSRDLLANPGEQDLTAHINFTDLVQAGERNGFTTLFLDIQAKFLLALGAHKHELLQPNDRVDTLELREQREEAKRLVLPDGIGADIRVLVQARGVPLDGWSFQKKLF